MNNQLQETQVSCKDGEYIVNERLVRRIIESYYRAKANLLFGKAKEMDTEWFEPDITVFEVDWEKARTWTQQHTTARLYSNWMVSMPMMRPRIDELIQMQRDTVMLAADFRRKVRELEKQSQQSRERMVDFWGGAASGAKLVRDGSASTLMVGATVLSGGSAAALFAGGAGTALRFTGKLQDAKGGWQDNLGAASAQAVGDLIFTVIPATRAGAVMRGAQGTEKAVLIFLEAQWDTGVSLLEGKEVSEAVLDGSMSLLFKASGELPGVQKLQKDLTSKLSGWVLPTMIRAVGDKRGGMQAAKTLAGGARDFGKDKLKGGLTAGANAARTAGSGGAISGNIVKKNIHRNGLDNAAIVDYGIVSRAVRRLH